MSLRFFSAGPLRSLRRVGPHIPNQGGALARIALFAVSIATLSAFEPLVLRALFDGLLSHDGRRRAMAAFAALAALLVTRDSLALLHDRAFWRTRLAINHALLRATVERLHSLPLSFHGEESVGATMTKIERGIQGAMTAFSEVVVQLVPAIVYLTVSIALMIRIDPTLSLVVAVFAPLPAVLGVFAAKEQATREQTLMDRWTRLFARFNEVLTGIVVVKSFAREEQEKRRFLRGVEDANAVVLRGVVTDSRVAAAKNAIMTTARLTALAVGGALVARHTVSVGTLIAFASYLGGLFAPIQALTGIHSTLHRASVSVEAILGILNAQDSLGDAANAPDAPPFRGEVRFDDVTFGYRPGSAVLRHVNLHVRKGEHVALVGPSGSGKSTLMALLQRLYDPTSGTISIDGVDIRSVKQRSLRAQIGVVLQEGMLFNDSIADNIAFGNAEATAEQIEAAARATNAHDFIERLPQGYETLAGERGTKLSGGERQRIAIARTLIKNAPIVILDEATSALDAENEANVSDALHRLTAGRTTFIVAHRLSTVTAADRIVVFKDGAIAEIGTHESLLRENGYYARLVHQQLSGLSPSAASARPSTSALAAEMAS